MFDDLNKYLNDALFIENIDSSIVYNRGSFNEKGNKTVKVIYGLICAVV